MSPALAGRFFDYWTAREEPEWLFYWCVCVCVYRFFLSIIEFSLYIEKEKQFRKGGNDQMLA